MELDAGERSLWERLRSAGDVSAREALYLHHMHWARAIARRVHRRFAAWTVDRDDFVQNASIGLLEAIDRFDPQRGIEFRAYAAARVRGSVFNGIRVLLGGSGQAARFDERLEFLADAGADDDVGGIVDSIVGLSLGYMLDALADGTLVELEDGLVFVQRSEVAAQLLAAVDALPPRLKTLVVRHYFEFVPFNALALEWGVTKGRVSQLHRAAMDQLKARIALD
ncbi:MAG TPA: sigma-70 family RNA polymerase sigma factor [Lysobacter sp.]